MSFKISNPLTRIRYYFFIQVKPKSFKSIEDKLLNLTDMSKDIKNDPKR